ncbi:MAG: acetate/propionate family kinase [Sphaerochaetaceae bacterium]|nr:acetate/propionate family kinase [Sphaerochaetaceae bacterium]
MLVLVCNAGSTSLKFKLYDMPSEKILARGGVERVGSESDALFKYESLLLEKQNIPDYKAGIRMFLDCLLSDERKILSDVSEIERVGFKTVLSRTCMGVSELTDEVMQGMKDWFVLAPVHNRAYLQSVSAMKEVLPHAKMVGVFETAFHKDIPLERKLYGVPYEWYEKYGVQKLGFHGASHTYISQCLNAESTEYKAISCHLGGSGSICAIENGKSVDTSFGMSLETGLVHANRVGSMDATMVWYLEQEGLTREQIKDGLQVNGGLKGLSGVSGDLRYVEEAAAKGNKRAALAIDVYVTGIVRYIGSYYMELGGLDYLVFTAGIGEHSPLVRKAVCEKLAHIGLVLDDKANLENRRIISSPSSSVKVLVIPTDEELVVARETQKE